MYRRAPMNHTGNFTFFSFRLRSVIFTSVPTRRFFCESNCFLGFFFAFFLQIGACLVNASWLKFLPHVPQATKSILNIGRIRLDSTQYIFSIVHMSNVSVVHGLVRTVQMAFFFPNIDCRILSSLLDFIF